MTPDPAATPDVVVLVVTEDAVDDFALLSVAAFVDVPFVGVSFVDPLLVDAGFVGFFVEPFAGAAPD